MSSDKKARCHGRGAALGIGPEKDGCSIAGRIWVQREGETLLAWGRVVLLERIRDLGSINAAAKSMGMGFRHAWLLVDEMNSSCPSPLVTRSTGGRGGGGTTLTAEGHMAVESFWRLVDSFNGWLSAQDPLLWGAPKRSMKSAAAGRGKSAAKTPAKNSARGGKPGANKSGKRARAASGGRRAR